MSLPQIFSFENHEVRTLEKDGEIWFVAADVANSLGYINTRDAISRHCKGVVIHDTPTLSGIQQMQIIPERDIYRLVMRSKLPSAEKFEEWVVSVVLPQIRKTGKYEVAPQFQIPQTLHEALQLAADQAKQLAEQQPLVAFAKAVNDSSNSMDLGSFAKILGTGRTRLFRWLKDEGYLMENGKPYQRYVDNEYFVVIETTYFKGDETHAYAKTQITGKGQIVVEKAFRTKKAA